MIIKIKNTGKILEGVVFDEHQKDSLFQFREDLRLVMFVCDKKEADIYHSDAEVQKMIESAVAEHEKLIKDEMQEWKDLANENRAALEEMKSKISYSEIDLDENRFIRTELEAVQKDRDKLLYEIDELKSKVREPIELSKEYCAELDRLLLTYIPMNVLHRCIRGYQDTKILHSVSLGDLVKALTDGYTVKPDPTLEEKILKSIKFPFGSDEDTVKEIMSILKNEGMLKDEEA